MSARAEAYLLLKRCCPVWGIERGACRVVRLAIETGVRRKRMSKASRPARKAYAHARSTGVSARSVPPCVPGLRAQRRLLPPSDAVPGVVASGARAVCADRVWSRGSPRRSAIAQLPSSSASCFHLDQDGMTRALIVPVGPGIHFSLTRTGTTVTSASGSTGKQWHTR